MGCCPGEGGGGDPSVLDANYPPQLTVGRRPLGGGGGVLGGGVLAGAPGRAVPRGGGGSGTSEQLGMRARWLHNPCRLGDPHRLRAGGRIRKGPQVGKVAT